VDWMSDKLSSRCIGPTYLPNHRVLRDSGTVFAGSERRRHKLYQADQTFISLNWQPFTDDETGIFMYAWALGTQPCLNDALDWLDPFSSTQSDADWSYDGARSEIPALPEGFYYLNVRAYNKIIRGGPLATTVCDTVPLIIDASKPVMNSFIVKYSDEARELQYIHNVTDHLSDLKSIAVGLGETQFDENLRGFEFFFNRSFTYVPAANLPEGVFMYGRLRAVDNVNWRTTVYSDQPLYLDYSPPNAGVVLDGPDFGVQLNLTYRNDVMSANWDGFFDKQSGIDMFQIAFSRAVVDENGAWLYDDVTPNSTINWLNLTGETIRISVPLPDDIRLEHNVVYHATIIAYNRGHLHLSNSSHSQGFLVDLTCPSFPLTRQTTFIAGFPPTDNPALRCMCPCPGCAFHPPELGDQCISE
jgi:hypothetical protein